MVSLTVHVGEVPAMYIMCTVESKNKILHNLCIDRNVSHVNLEIRVHIIKKYFFLFLSQNIRCGYSKNEMVLLSTQNVC